jgi:hypothetical protein
LEVKAELDAGRITRRLIPGGEDWFDADAAAYEAAQKAKVKPKAKIVKYEETDE